MAGDFENGVEAWLARVSSLSPEERARALDDCADPGVRAEIEWRLRDGADDSLSVLLHGAGSLVRSAASPRAENPGDLIDAYRLVEPIGEGGMGIVWRAEQQRPIRRSVALKLIKVGMDTRAVAARFESERQALALMTHPNIARVLDGGVTRSGRPYFVMEIVEGESITSYCDRCRLGTRARLELLIDVCNGIHHAHQKGIIHRDLKPSNVLVEEHDGRAVPRIIDFGVAKATDRALTEHTLYTDLGQVVGTPAYMSPEQASLDAHAIDTRTDVYSLGVLLYEMLVGSLPFDRSDSPSVDEIRRRIREEDPPTPSRRLSGLAHSAGAIAEARGASGRALRRTLRGDLDWITMKALDRDRERRYSSAAELAAELRRYLRDEAVLAGPPTMRYRIGKFVRRHRAPVIAAGLIAATLIAATAISIALLVRAERSEREAVSQRQTAQQISTFLESMLASVDPQVARGRDVSLLREILDETSTRIDGEFDANSEVAARLHLTMGKTYRFIGELEEAEKHLRSALRARQTRGSDRRLELAEAAYELGALLSDESRFAAAESLLDVALTIRAEHRDTRGKEYLASVTEMAILKQATGDPHAEDFFREAIPIARREYGERDSQYADKLKDLGGYLWYRERREEGGPLLDEALAIWRQADEPNPLGLANMLQDAALRCRDVGRYEEAEPLFLEALQIKRSLLKPDHPEIALTLSNLGGLYEFRGDYEAAEPPYREALRIYANLGETSMDVGTAHNNLAGLLRKLGRHDESEEHFREALRLYRSVLGDDHAFVAIVLGNLARLCEAAGWCERLDEVAIEFHRIASKYWPDGHPRRAAVESVRGGCLTRQGRYEEAEAVLLQAHERLAEAQEPGTPDRRDSGARLVTLYEAWGKPEKAGPYRSPPETD